MAEVAEKTIEQEASVGAEESKNGDEAGIEESLKKDAALGENAELSKFERRIIRQVEYYFGDANLNRDKFLMEQITKDEDGWVPFSVLQTFNRLAELSTDRDVIIDALLKSDEGLLEISEDRLKVRRHPERPIPERNEEVRKEIMSRTAYAKGFPLDTDMSQLIDFFSPYEKVLNINMRKYLDKPTKTYKFKGSVFVTFEKKEQTMEFIEKEKVLFGDRVLLRKWQDQYIEEKKEEINSRLKSKKSKGKPFEEKPIELSKGAVLHFEGGTESLTREMIRDALEKCKGDWEIAFIDYSKGNENGYIRFQDENVAVKFIEKFANKLRVADDVELSVRVLTDDEEKEYLAKTVEHIKNRRNQSNKRKGNHLKRRLHSNRNDFKKKKSSESDE